VILPVVVAGLLATWVRILSSISKVCTVLGDPRLCVARVNVPLSLRFQGILGTFLHSELSEQEIAPHTCGVTHVYCHSKDAQLTTKICISKLNHPIYLSLLNRFSNFVFKFFNLSYSMYMFKNLNKDKNCYKNTYFQEYCLALCMFLARNHK
jgi:hypothetical protein